MSIRSMSKKTVHHALSFVMSFVMVLTTIFGSGIPSESVQAATKTVKSVRISPSNSQDIFAVPDVHQCTGQALL